MSNLMINKLKHIEQSRKDLQTILENKGIDLNSSNKSLDSLITNVSQLNKDNIVNADDWTGVEEQEEPAYWKGDEDWGSIIDIDAIMEADTENYTGKAFFLIRCSDNDTLDEYPSGYTNGAIVGFQAYRFSDQGSGDALATTTAHKFDKTKDIVAPNGERFRWIIGYTNSTAAVVLWQGSKLVVEAAVYWSGTYRGICFEDVAPAYGSSTDYSKRYAYDNGSGGYNYLDSFSITNYNVGYLRCMAPRYFEVKDGVTTQFITGSYSDRYAGSINGYRTRTIIIDGTCVCDFVHSAQYDCTFTRISKPGYRRYLYLTCNNYADGNPAYVYADVSGCKGTIWCSAHHAYIRLKGDMQPCTLNLGGMRNTNMLCDNVWTVAGAANSHDTNYDFKVIQGSVNENAFAHLRGHLKFDRIEQGIGHWAFWDAKNIPTEIIVKKREDYTGTHGLGYGAFSGTNVEKIDLRESAITSMSSFEVDPETNEGAGTYVRGLIKQPFYGAQHLRFLILPKSMKTLPAWSLSKLYNVESIVLPDDIVTIGRYAMTSNRKLKSISAIPDTLQTIGDHPFSWNVNLESVELNSKTLTSTPGSCFEGCTQLHKVILPEKLITLGDNTFYDCNELTTVTLPNTVTNIGAYAFSGCLMLENVEFEDPTVGYLTNINSYAFARCFSLTHIPDLSQLTQASYTKAHSPFQDCKSMTFTLLTNKPVNMDNTTYYEYFYRGTGGRFLVPEDYAYTGTIKLGGARWSVQDMVDFIYSLPDRTGGTAIKLTMGCPRTAMRYKYHDYSYTEDYSAWGAGIKLYYVKENEEGTGLDYSIEQADDTWISVSDYLAAKNCTIS